MLDPQSADGGAGETRSRAAVLPLRSVGRTLVRVATKWKVIMAKRLPDEHEAIEGAQVATDTAVGLLSNADLLGRAGNFGTALPLAVLALEESVKARTLGAVAAAAAQGRLPGFSEEDLRKIVYSGHRERHDAGFIQHVAAACPDIYGRIMLGMPVDVAEAEKILELRGILATANSRKQAGLYSDFDPISGSWSSPDSVPETEFAKIRALISDYVSETKRQFDEFTRYRDAPRPAWEES
jgi:AbiV family abortive infection protein